LAKRKLLILGGTAEARKLAEALENTDWQVTNSLAGRTSNPASIPGELRVGGFGGMDGLMKYLVSETIFAVIDATHPFAARISANAAKACRRAKRPLLRLERPEWQMGPRDDWHIVPCVEDAVSEAPPGARLFLTLGHQEMALFDQRRDIWFLARMIEHPPARPVHGKVLIGRPPYTYDNERALLKNRRITHLVTRNSGGDQTAAKLRAARDMKLSVIMIARPPGIASVTRMETPGQAIDWLDYMI